MRISDLSSDVCSSDLPPGRPAPVRPLPHLLPALPLRLPRSPSRRIVRHATFPGERRPALARTRRSLRTLRNPIAAAGPFSSTTTTGDAHATPCTRQRPALHPRSEEHTSELQTIMTISY